MQADFKKMSITAFRDSVAAQLRDVEETGVQLLLTRHGRVGCAVLPFYQLRMLDEVLDLPMQVKTRKAQREYDRYTVAKKLQRKMELERLARGLECGGAVRTRRMRGMLEQGRDPWGEDPVLITGENVEWRGS